MDRKVLMIVPTVNLVTQMKQDFDDYSKNIELDLKTSKLILKKCGFVYEDKKRLINFLNTYVKFIYFSTPLNSTNLFNTSFYQKEKFLLRMSLKILFLQ